jgi:hypothetical protein
VLAVKGIDAGAGAGALIAELDLPTGMVVTDSSWKVHNLEVSGWESPGFDDTLWAGATSYGQYGVGPWGTAVSNIPAGSPAKWIWSADSDGDDVVFFRYTIAAGPVALAVQTTTLPAGEVEQTYAANLTAIGGSGSYSWSLGDWRQRLLQLEPRGRDSTRGTDPGRRDGRDQWNADGGRDQQLHGAGAGRRLEYRDPGAVHHRRPRAAGSGDVAHQRRQR